MRTWPALVLACLLCAVPALGLEPYLVKDINPVPQVTGSSPSNFVSLGGVAVFAAFEGETGLTLWRSDGTPAGTWRLAEICPLVGACGNAQVLATVGGRAFLNLGPDVWVTDGSVAGTLRLTDGLLAASPGAAWVPEQRALYFAGTDRAHGTELWRTDGTPAGTWLVTDLAPGPQSPQVWTLTAFRGQVWFATRTGPRGGAVWRSDGTERGTVLVKGSGRPVLPFIRGVVGKRLLFSGPFGRQGQELWASDGTERGTSPVLRLRSEIRDAVVQSGRLFFVADNPGHGQELWVSDGTVRGSRVLSDIPGKEAFFANSGAYSLYLPRTSLSGRFFFQAWDPAHGVELWVSDGTPAGTRLLRDVCPGPCPGVDRVLMSNQGLFYFAGSNGVRGVELWASDGTSAGTRLVRDLCRGACGSDPFFPSRFAGRLLFAANDGVNGRELWSTDGTAAGTVRLTDVASPDPESSFAPGAALTGGRYLFAAADGEQGSELWVTDGTAAGTALVADINQADFGGSAISGLRALGDEAIFFADDGIRGHELWKSDGTAAGTSLVADLLPGPEPYFPPAVVSSAEAGGKLFLLLLGELGHGGFSLWQTNGTAAGTLQLRDSSSRPVLWNGSDLRAAGGTVFFTLSNGDLGQQLWATDGTVAGTRQVVDSGPGKALFNPFGLTELNGKLFFFATAPDGSFGLWRSDGTAPGTVQAKSFGAPYGGVPLPTLHAGRLWFFAAAPSGFELWTSDGTAPGTRTVPGFAALQPSFMASIGTKLMISGLQGLWATDGSAETLQKVGPRLYDNAPGIPWTVFQGRLVYAVDEHFDGYPKLWTSDGTSAGTAPLLDHDGQLIPAPLDFASLDDVLIFTTATPAAIWETDGTSAGTRPIAPMRPIGFNPGAVVRAGDRVFFGAWEPDTGQELWAVEP